MLPSFHRLVEENFDQNVAQLSGQQVPNAEQVIRSLMELKSLATTHLQQFVLRRRRTVPPWFKSLRRVTAAAPSAAAVMGVIVDFVRRHDDPTTAFLHFEESPRTLELLARLGSGSPFLTEILLADPGSIQELLSPTAAEIRDRGQFLREAGEALQAPDASEFRHRLRRFQKRQVLRIGTCDAFGFMNLSHVTLQLSLLADAVIQTCLEDSARRLGSSEGADSLAVIAFGKLGGEELNYSSDVDLVLVADDCGPARQRLARVLIDSITENLSSGFLYRVDMRLRPWGDAGPLVCSSSEWPQYIRNNAELWERQALLKARVIGGNKELGERLLAEIRPEIFRSPAEVVVQEIRGMKNRIEQVLQSRGRLRRNVKLGEGSIRDIEFVVQALQIMYGADRSRIVCPNTLTSLVRLTEHDLLDAAEYRRLREGYVFLRSVEHSLQLFRNQHTHELPADDERLTDLARRLDFPDRETLLSRFEDHRQAIRRVFSRMLPDVSRDAAVLPDYRSRPDDAVSPEPSQENTELRNASVTRSLLDRLMHEVSAEQPVRIEFLPTEAQLPQGVSPVPGDELSAPAEAVLLICMVNLPSSLSSMFGCLLAEGFDIRRGRITTSPLDADQHQRRVGVLAACLTVVHSGRAAVTAPSLTEAVERRLTGLLTLVQEGHRDEARQQMFEYVSSSLKQHPEPSSATSDFDLTVRQSSLPADFGMFPSAASPASAMIPVTLVQVTGTDAPGFLFELANSLSVSGFRIAAADVDTAQNTVTDTLYIVDADGRPVDSPVRLHELQTSVTLIREFTRWLPATADPESALQNFRSLLSMIFVSPQDHELTDRLAAPRVLGEISRVLGVSRYLWDQLLRFRPRKLIRLLEDEKALAAPLGRRRLRSLFEGPVSADSYSQMVAALNQNRDECLFRIDLRHVTGHCRPFGTFSREITELADYVVSRACSLAYCRLQAEHGEPRSDSGGLCRYTVAALGKFGGQEMGYASDLELFLIYDEDGRTDGSNAISAGSFFERLVLLLPQIIRSSRQGIFEIDLRLRPYGAAGSPASPRPAVLQYFSPQGAAWPFERQAMVKLRCVAGDPEFAAQTESECREVIYAQESFDFAAMHAMRERQISQLVRGGTVHAKLSQGGLVDCEYAVQALQLVFGRRFPELQSASSLPALKAAARAELISSLEYSDIRAAYAFLRELIDCLRMVRGNAQDLTVPDPDTRDFRQLAERMRIVHGTQLSEDILNRCFARVSRFADQVELTCRSRSTSRG